MIPYSTQDISESDIAAVVEVLKSANLTQGSMLPAFEQAVAARSRARHAVAVNSGTSALHIACLALGLGKGDILWTVPNTFVASANCARYCGADVDFVDIDPVSWNLSISALKEKLVHAKLIGKLPKVLVPVHFSGQPTNQEAIWELAEEYDFMVLEDASHSIGASRRGEPVGSCKWSHITVFSFHPVKNITTGEGGMALTNNDEFAWQMETLRTHGITRDERRMKYENRGPWYYEQLTLGFNYRMTDIQAALGMSQLLRLDEFISRRNVLAQRYNKLLAEMPLQKPSVRDGNYSAFHIYVVRLQLQSISHSHREVFEYLRGKGIGVNLHYLPVHLQPYYREMGFGPGLCPEAERYAEEALTLPLYPKLSEKQQDRVIAALDEILR